MSEQDIPIPESEPRTRWSEVSGGIGAATAYQRHFDELAAQGLDIHGEAALIEKLVSPPARILDAGCGTGRVATQLTSLGYHCVGVDADRQMIAVAERRDPATLWVQQDLSRLELRSQAFDLAVLAGNVVPLLAPGTLDATMQRITAHVQPGGLVVAGFGLDAAHLPPGSPSRRWRTTTAPARSRDCRSCAATARGTGSRGARASGTSGEHPPTQRLERREASATASVVEVVVPGAVFLVPPLGLLPGDLEGARCLVLGVVGPMRSSPCPWSRRSRPCRCRRCTSTPPEPSSREARLCLDSTVCR